MNSRYNIGKVLYKVDSYVDRSQETIYTQNIISDNQIVKDELTIGEGLDDSIVKISQSTNPSTGELEGNIETPNIKITKELKFEGDNNTTIDNSGINADTIYVNNLYTNNYNPTNLKTQNIVIVDENEQETGTKITKDGIEANTIKAQNLDVEGLNIDELTFKNEQETITTTINKDGITINNTNNNKSIGLNSDGELYFNNKKVNDIKQATTISNKDNLLTTQGYVDEAINEAIIGGLDNIEVNVIKSKASDHSVDVYADLILKDNNDVKYDVIAGNVIGTYKSEYSDNPKVLINNTNGITLTNSEITLTNTNSNISLNDNGITLNGTTINSIITSNTQGATNDTIPTTDKVNDMIESHVPVLTEYARKDQANEFIANNTFNNGTITFNNGLTTTSITMDNTTISSITTGPNDNTSIPTTSKVEELISAIDLTNYVQKTGSNEINANNTFTGNNYFNNGISTSNNNNLVLTSSSNIIEFGSKNTKSNITTTSQLEDTLTIDNIKVNKINNDNSQLTLLNTTITNSNNEDTLTTNNIIATNYQINKITSGSKNMNKVSDDIQDATTIKNTTLSTEAYVDKKLNDFQLIGDYQSTEGNTPNVKITNSDGIISSNYKSASENPNVVITNSGIITNKLSFDSNKYATTIEIYNDPPQESDNHTLASKAYVDSLIGGGASILVGTYKTDTGATPKVEINKDTGNINVNGNTLQIDQSGNLTTNGTITGNYQSSLSTPKVSIDNTNGITTSESIKANGGITTTSNNLSLTSNNNIVDINDTINVNNIYARTNETSMKISVKNGYNTTSEDTTQYIINFGNSTTLTTKQIDNTYEMKDIFKTDSLEAEELIVKEIDVVPGGIFSDKPIKTGSIESNVNIPKAGLYETGEIKTNKSIELLSGSNIDGTANNLVKIYKDNNDTYGIVDVYNNGISNITLDGNDGTITTKKINLPMGTNDNKTIIKVSEDITSSQTTKDTILSTEAYVDDQFTKGTNTFIGTYNSATSNNNIIIDNTNGITTKYSINEPNIITLDNSIDTYKGITYTFNTNTATITGIDMTNEQTIIIPRYIIKGSTYYKVNNINLSNKTYLDNGYIYIPDTIEFINSDNIDSLLDDTHIILINMSINLYCSYLNGLSQSNTYTHTIILRENKQSSIYNMSNNTYSSGCFIINLSSIKSIYLETDKTKITTLFNEYASFYPDKFKNMPSEHYDILSNLEKYINDKLIKESNKKMVYLKNGFTKTMTTLPVNTSTDAITYNPYYKETLKTGQRQIFNTELNNVIINTGNEFKYKYNFQDDNNYTTIDLTGITNIDYEFQHSFVMNETLYNVNRDLSNNIISIKSLWSFNQNIKLNEVYTTDITLGANYYSLYVYPYIIIYGINNNEKVLYYSNNLLYWQKIILDANISENLYYVNDKFNKLLINDINFTLENTLIIHKITDDYYIYPSYTKEELFMRM